MNQDRIFKPINTTLKNKIGTMNKQNYFKVLDNNSIYYAQKMITKLYKDIQIQQMNFNLSIIEENQNIVRIRTEVLQVILKLLINDEGACVFTLYQYDIILTPKL